MVDEIFFSKVKFVLISPKCNEGLLNSTHRDDVMKNVCPSVRSDCKSYVLDVLIIGSIKNHTVKLGRIYRDMFMCNFLTPYKKNHFGLSNGFRFPSIIITKRKIYYLFSNIICFTVIYTIMIIITIILCKTITYYKIHDIARKRKKKKSK